MACAVEMPGASELHPAAQKRRRSLGALLTSSCSQRQRLCEGVGMLSLSGGSGSLPSSSYHPAAQTMSTVVRQCIGNRQYNEDRFVVCANICDPQCPSVRSGSPGSSRSEVVKAPAHALQFVGVFDGHGGAAVAQHCSETMLQHLQKNLRRAAEEGACAGSLHMSPPGPEQQAVVTAALKQSFQDCDEALTEEASAEGGSTAVCAIVGPTHLWVASCGDSRAVVVRTTGETVALTDDHKPERPDEMERIKAAGGHVFWNGGHRVMGVLSMSRAIGDRYLKKYGVIPEPDTTCVPRTPTDDFMLIASDGLWGGLSNEEAGAMARACISRAEARGVGREAALRVATHVLIKAAMAAGSHDNITVAVVDLAGPREQQAQQQQQPKPQQQVPPLHRQDAVPFQAMLAAVQALGDASRASGSSSDEEAAVAPSPAVAVAVAPDGGHNPQAASSSPERDVCAGTAAVAAAATRLPDPATIPPAMDVEACARIAPLHLPPSSAPISPCTSQQRQAWHVMGAAGNGLDLMKAPYTRCVSMPSRMTPSSAQQSSLGRFSHPPPPPPMTLTAPTPVTTGLPVGAGSTSGPLPVCTTSAPPQPRVMSAPTSPVHPSLAQVGQSASMPRLPSHASHARSRLGCAPPPVLDVSAERLLVALEPASAGLCPAGPCPTVAAVAEVQ